MILFQSARPGILNWSALIARPDGPAPAQSAASASTRAGNSSRAKRPGPRSPASTTRRGGASTCPHDWAIEGPFAHRARPAPGRPALLRHRLVPQAVHAARGRRDEALRDRVRRRHVERPRLAERRRTRRPAVRLHRLRLRPDAAPALRQGERPRRAPDAREGLLALVSGSGHLPQRVARRHGAGARGPLGHLRHHARRSPTPRPPSQIKTEIATHGTAPRKATLETVVLDAGGQAGRQDHE